MEFHNSLLDIKKPWFKTRLLFPLPVKLRIFPQHSNLVPVKISNCHTAQKYDIHNKATENTNLFLNHSKQMIKLLKTHNYEI